MSYREVGQYPSSSTVGKFYTVKEKDGVLSCDCPVWVFNHRKNRTCKHTDMASGTTKKIIIAQGKDWKTITTVSHNWTYPLQPPQRRRRTGVFHQVIHTKPLRLPPVHSSDEVQPMLAARVDASKVRLLMRDPKWVAELKLDGSRYVAHFKDDGVHFYSRRTSVVDGNKVEKTDNLPHLNEAVKYLTGTILDGEIMAHGGKSSNDATRIMGAHPDKAVARQKEEGNVRYMVFDVLSYKGKDIQSLSFRERAVYRKKVIAVWGNPYAKRLTYTFKKEELLHEAWKQGLEGIILKNLEAPYTQDSRSPSAWVKIKKIQSYDVVITGYENPEKITEKTDGTVSESRFHKNGWIGSIKFGAYHNGKLKEIGSTSGMDDKTREQLSKYGKKFIGTVIEIDGQEVIKDGIRHPRFIRFRDDKDPQDCQWKDIFKTAGRRYE